MTKVEEILDEFCSGRATLAAAEAALQQGRSSGVIDEAQLRAVVDRFVSDGQLAAVSPNPGGMGPGVAA